MMEKVNYIKNFEVFLPESSSENRKSEKITGQALTTDEILLWEEDRREELKKEIETVFSDVFPDRNDWINFIGYYFKKPPCLNLQRYAVLYRNKDKKLIATTIFDHGDTDYQGNTVKASSIIVSSILLEYQNFNIAQMIAVKILTELQPDIFMTTCAQSSALYSRLNIIRKGLVKGYEVFPRLENDQLIHFPFKDLDFAICIFKQLYYGFADGQQKRIDRAVRNLSVFLARKSINVTYDFDPWYKNGREDKIAKELGLTSKDGVLVIFRKIT